MTKISLLAALALVSVCSALDVYTDIGFQGDFCRFATPHTECIKVPEPCYGQVKSMWISSEWDCDLFDNDGCIASESFTIAYGSLPSLKYNHQLKAVRCWENGSL
ncbi:MAG: hypothetical protein J3Q66DRAFT_369669 [Benniella sp.]|nr:MAG: hypothetical protein J3Q66DRAFT_369669 [Benniella sp.]